MITTTVCSPVMLCHRYVGRASRTNVIELLLMSGAYENVNTVE